MKGLYDQWPWNSLIFSLSLLPEGLLKSSLLLKLWSSMGGGGGEWQGRDCKVTWRGKRDESFQKDLYITSSSAMRHHRQRVALLSPTWMSDISWRRWRRAILRGVALQAVGVLLMRMLGGELVHVWDCVSAGRLYPIIHSRHHSVLDPLRMMMSAFSQAGNVSLSDSGHRLHLNVICNQKLPVLGRDFERFEKLSAIHS